MRTHYSVYEAKTKLSEILRQVKQNRPVIITERGREMARVVPISGDASIERRLEDLVAAGILSPKPAGSRAGIRPVARRPGALNRFIESREDR